MRACSLHLLRSSAILWLVACGPKAPALGSGSATDTSDASTSGTAPESSGSSTSAAATTTTTTNPTTADPPPPDLPCLDCTTGPPPDLPPVDCDIWTQDCPSGQKCMPYSRDGFSLWDADGCFPVVDNPVPLGEPCTIEGNSGIDDCDVGAICWDPNGDNEFTCAPLCAGTADELTCPPGYYCAAYSEGLTVCELPTCDPLAQDCPDPNELCLPNIYLWEDWCLPDDSPLANQLHEPCDGETECAAGLVCVSNILAAAECKTGGWGCCEPFCQIGTDTCPGVGQVCSPWVEALGLGVCGLPLP